MTGERAEAKREVDRALQLENELQQCLIEVPDLKSLSHEDKQAWKAKTTKFLSNEKALLKEVEGDPGILKWVEAFNPGMLTKEFCWRAYRANLSKQNTCEVHPT